MHAPEYLFTVALINALAIVSLYVVVFFQSFSVGACVIFAIMCLGVQLKSIFAASMKINAAGN